MNALTVPLWEEKCWGRVCHCFAAELASVSYLEVIEGFCCSIHKHTERANQFILIEGVVSIETYLNEAFDRPYSKITLQDGGHFTVPSGQYHRFVVLESGRMIECYWPDRGGICRMDDIVRFDQGGPV